MSKQKRQSISDCPSKHIPFTAAVYQPYECPPGKQAKPLYSQCKLRLLLDCEGCSHLEWIPHAAQQEAEPLLCCSVSSTLHQDCFVCHQVIKVAECSAVSGVVVLKLGQQEAVSQARHRFLVSPHTSPGCKDTFPTSP